MYTYSFRVVNIVLHSKEIKLFERKFKVSFIIVLLLSSQVIFHTPPFFVDSMREALRLQIIILNKIATCFVPVFLLG